MAEQTQLLIETIQQYPLLFDASHKHYKDIAKKTEAWDEIASKLNITSQTAKLKWKNLRDCYIKHKKFKLGARGQTSKYGSWAWSKSMSFLDDTLRSRSLTLDVTQSSSTASGDALEDSPPPMTDSKESIQLVSPPTPEPVPVSAPPRKKLKTTPGKNASKPRQPDGVDHLFLSYAETFKKFRPTTQALVKLQLATLFAQTELNEELNEMRDQGAPPASAATTLYALVNSSVNTNGAHT